MLQPLRAPRRIHPHSFGRRPGWRFLLAGLATVALLLAGRPALVNAQIPGGLNVTLDASPSTAAPGQVVTFRYSASPPAVAPPFPRIDSTQIDYGDGRVESGQTGRSGETVSGTFTHVYTSPGTYTATLTATASNGSSGTAVASVTVTGGGGNVTVTVTPSTNQTNPGQPVSFSYSATTSFGIGFPQIRSMLISYGDGAPLPLNPPSGTVSHSYSAPGTYTVVVTATDTSGAQGRATTVIQVSPGPTPPISISAGGPYSGTVGSLITMTGNTSGGAFPPFQYQYNWSFGDGTAGSGQTTAHAYSNPGTYSILLTVISPGGQSRTATTTATVIQGLSISAGTSMTGIAGQPVRFGATVTGAVNPVITWSFGDGTTGSGQFPTHTYTNPGVYTAQATVVDTSTGQQASDSVIVSIGTALSVDAGGPYSGITGQPVALQSTVSGATQPQYLWNFGNGSTSTAANPTATYSSSGVYTITLTVTDAATGQTAADTATAVIEASGPVVTYQPGWNLVSGPSGTLFTQAAGPLYTFQAGDTAYEVIGRSGGVQAGLGYWAYFNGLTTVTMAGNGSTSATINVPAGQFVMIGNPSSTTALRITGADMAVSWDPTTSSWKNVSELAPGAGAWVYIAAGGAVRLSP
jgi:PKD repeat protein